MDTLVEYLSIGVRIGEHCLFDAIDAVSELRVTVKVYLILLHLFCLSLLFLSIKLKSKGRVFAAKKTTRSTVFGDVRVESCEWVNSTLEWFFRHSLSHRTPAIIKFWINALNRQLSKDQKVFTCLIQYFLILFYSWLKVFLYFLLLIVAV